MKFNYTAIGLNKLRMAVSSEGANANTVSNGVAGAGSLANADLSTGATGEHDRDGLDRSNLSTTLSHERTMTHQAMDTSRPDLHEVDIAKLITKVRPTTAVLDQIARTIGSEQSCNSIEVGLEELGTRPITDEVKTAVASSGYSTNGNDNGYDVTVDIEPKNLSQWKKHDVFVANGQNYYIYHIASGKLKCTLIAPPVPTTNASGAYNTAYPAITANTVMLRIGTAVNELQAMISSNTLLPERRTNYCQTQMALVSQSVIEGLVAKKVPIGFDTYRENELWDFRRAIELQYLFGKKFKGVDRSDQTNNNLRTIYFADGLWNQIKRKVSITGIVNESNGWSYDEFCSSIFEAQNGSESKILLCGHKLLSKLADSKDYQKQLSARETKVVGGIRFNRIETNHGVLLLRPHELFVGAHESDGIVVDPAFIVKKTLEKTQIKDLDLDTAGIERSKNVRILETSCIMAANLPTHCKISWSQS